MAMAKSLQLPLITKVGSEAIPVVIRQCEGRHFEKTYNLLNRQAVSDGIFTEHEVERNSLTCRKSSRKPDSKVLFTVVTEKNPDDVMCAMSVAPSRLCRSTRPMLGTGISVTQAKYGETALTDIFSHAMKLDALQGRVGMHALVSVSGPSLPATVSLGATVTGAVPYANCLSKDVFADDIMMYLPYQTETTNPEQYKSILDERRKPIPALQRDVAMVPDLCEWNQFEAAEVRTDLGVVRVRSIRSLDELWETETLIRTAAEKGQGFGIDEFNDQGHFNRNFLKNVDILIAENADGDVIGATLFGPSNLSRAKTPVIAHQYMVVRESYRNAGIAQALLTRCEDILRHQGYRMVISDTYLNNHAMIHIFRKAGFAFRGSFPYCSYMNDVGPVQSLLTCKDLI